MKNRYYELRCKDCGELMDLDHRNKCIKPVKTQSRIDNIVNEIGEVNTTLKELTRRLQRVESEMKYWPDEDIKDNYGENGPNKI